MAIDAGRIEAAVSELLAAIGEDVTRPGIVDTPKRVAESYAEFFSGIGADPLEFLAGTVELGEGELGELVLVRDIEFRSMCEHHLLPFAGLANVAYVPNKRVVGLGNLPRVVETLASRAQLQERLTEEIAATLDEGLAPRGVLVMLDASQACVTSRGARQAHSTTVTVATRGILSDPVQSAAVLGMLHTPERTIGR